MFRRPLRPAFSPQRRQWTSPRPELRLICGSCLGLTNIAPICESSIKSHPVVWVYHMLFPQSVAPNIAVRMLTFLQPCPWSRSTHCRQVIHRTRRLHFPASCYRSRRRLCWSTARLLQIRQAARPTLPCHQRAEDLVRGRQVQGAAYGNVLLGRDFERIAASL